MESNLSEFIEFVADHALLAYLTIFMAALLEAVPVLGSFIPGSTVILALAALVPSGNLKLVPVLAAAIVGALVGDGAAFWIGYRAKRGILESWPLSHYPGVIAESEHFFHRHGTLAVFFARFVPPIRAFVPIVAGALSMAPSRFYSVNFIAIVLWAPVIILPGVLAGSAAEQWGARAKHYGLPLVAGLIIIGVASWAFFHWRKKRKTAGANTTSA